MAQLVAVHLAGCSGCAGCTSGEGGQHSLAELPVCCGSCGHTGTCAPESSTHRGAVLTAPANTQDYTSESV